MAVSDDVCMIYIYDMIRKEFLHWDVIFSKSEQSFAARSYIVSYQFIKA